MGRLATQTIIADASYQYQYAYNSLGALHTITWPTSTSGVRVKAKYLYTNGRLTQIRQFTGDVDGPNLWSLNLLDAAGRATSEAYGNGLWLQSAFDPLTGLVSARRSGTGGSESNVQQLAYGWDEAGNLTSRQDLNQGLTETFGYDALERLTSATGPGGTLTVVYDAIGNITYRSDVGTYSYHATKKHAVTAAGSNSYSYDANGNLKTRNGKSLTWRSYNLPSLINGVGYSASFSYTPDRRRWRQVSGYASGNETTIYVGALLEKLSTPVRKHWKHRIPTPSGEVQVIRRNDGTSETLYFANDHLGSVDAVLNASGAVVSRPSFNAWGARRGSNWQGAPSSTEWQAIADTTRRGYTGHEHLDNVMLVHMNGRVYDPAIGRFLSADPIIDCVQDMAGWNRYSYLKNNPLAFTDPRGFSRLPPSPALQRVDPGLNGLENIVVEGSRLESIWESFRAGIALNFYVTTTAGSTATGGGGGQSGGDGAKQREEEQRKCVMDCVESKTPEIYALTAMAGTAPTGNPIAVSAAAAVGYLAGLAKINDQGAIGPGIVATAAGHVAAMFDHRPSAAGVVTGAISAAAGDAIGNHFEGPSGAFWGGATAGAVDSLPAAASMLRQGATRSALGAVGLRALSTGGAALGGYVLASRLAAASCESQCSGQ